MKSHPITFPNSAQFPAPACIFGGGVVGAILKLVELGQKPY